MNNIEMLAKFQETIRNLDIDPDIDIPTHEISSALTEAELLFVDEFYNSFEKNEKARKALNNLVTTYITTTFTNSTIFNNGKNITLPDNLRYVLMESGTINLEDCGEVNNELRKEVMVKPVKLDYYMKEINNPFRKPGPNVIWRIDADVQGNSSYNTHVLIIPDKATLFNYKLVYLKNPSGIDIENNPMGKSLINESFHLDLVNIAVKIMLNRLKINLLFKSPNSLNQQEEKQKENQKD